MLPSSRSLRTPFTLQMILKYCDVKKEARPEPTDESPLTSFSLLMSPSRPSNTVGSTEKDSTEQPVNLILPDDLPIDLRVKIVVCFIHLRQLNLVKVRDVLPIVIIKRVVATYGDAPPYKMQVFCSLVTRPRHPAFVPDAQDTGYPAQRKY